MLRIQAKLLIVSTFIIASASLSVDYIYNTLELVGLI